MATSSETGFHGRSPNGTGLDPDEEDHYALLGVPFTASQAEIRRAYRRAMKRVHPDRQRPERREDFEDLARRLNAAFTILSDPIKRQAYDRTIRQQVIQDQVMQRYVGGFQTFDARSASPRAHRPQPTTAERRERTAADRQASLTLVVYAAAVTALILAALLVGSLLGSVLEAVR